MSLTATRPTTVPTAVIGASGRRHQDNGPTPAILIKDGPGCVTLQNMNSYSGGTFINNGILIAGGANTSQVLEPNTTGFGTITVNAPGILEFGYGTQNATLAYSITNSIILAGGKLLADDGAQHLTGPLKAFLRRHAAGSTLRWRWRSQHRKQGVVCGRRRQRFRSAISPAVRQRRRE